MIAADVVSHAHRIDLVSARFRTFLEGTKPLFVRRQEPVAGARSQEEKKQPAL
jgi:hypothetical protein